MPADEALADEIRAVLAQDDVLATEKRMFGGLCFLVDGHIAVAASGAGGLLVRCEPEETEALLAEPGVAPMEMRGRPVSGYLRVDTDDVAPWVRRGVARARSLPPK